MNYGLNIAASGVLTSLYRQDVLSNNLANVNTAGFKPDIVATRARDAARIEDGLFHLPSNAMLERLGAGVLMAPNRVSLDQGALERTGAPLDLAIEGEGFFVVSAGSGTDTERLRLTRDGRLTLDSRGRLVQAASGLPLLDVNGRPIRLDPGAEANVGPDGTIVQNGAAVARLQIAAVTDPAGLEKAGDNLFRISSGEVVSKRAGTGKVVSGFYERSAVDPIEAMMEITAAANAVATGGRMIQLFDELMGRAISTFARLA